MALLGRIKTDGFVQDEVIIFREVLWLRGRKTRHY
jgi:hypothetical protein